MRYRFPLPVGRRCSASQSLQLGTSTSLRDHGYGLVYHAMCLFTPQLSQGSHISLLQTAGSG